MIIFLPWFHFMLVINGGILISCLLLLLMVDGEIGERDCGGSGFMGGGGDLVVGRW